ncbi:hypothetical protein D3C72_2543270 [compost metagenome]
MHLVELFEILSVIPDALPERGWLQPFRSNARTRITGFDMFFIFDDFKSCLEGG